MTKKIFIAFIAIFTIGASSLFGKATAIYSWQVVTCGGDKQCQWDDLLNPNNVTYNELSGYYVSKATHTGNGYSATVVFGDNIDKEPVVGIGAEDGELEQTIKRAGYTIFIHRYYKGRMSGLFKSFYSEGNTVLSSMNRFLRYP